MIPRSWLYVPADDADRLAKAATRGADALIVDLEDGVAGSAKSRARDNLREFLDVAAGAAQVWVRVTSDPDGLVLDLDACLHPNIAGVVLAKAQDPEQLTMVAARLRGLPGPTRGFMPLIETGRAVFSLGDLAAVDGVTQLQVGEADLRADLGVTFSPDESELLLVRQRVVIVSAALGLLPPVAPVSVEFRDLDAFRSGTARLARMGYVGRACIHPAQVAIATDVFTPSEQELAEARALVAAADQAAAEGRGAFTDARGRMVDEAVVRSARRRLLLGPIHASTEA
jgi:citrate lyase subunit beta / citryl-CoA lyase